MMKLNTIKNIYIVLLLAVCFSSCSEYQAILKQRDNNLWYRKGMEYYAQGDYVKAANLLGGVLTAYSGTSRADTITVTYAKSLVEIGDYYTAAHYFQTYVRTYPSSENCEECQYLSGYCYYKLSPKVLLDQADTEQSIYEFQTLLNLYPDSKYTAEVERMMKEMEDKMAYKAYLNAKLYFDLGNYRGNNYRSAVIVAQNCLKKYPDTKHREELSFLILESKYIQAERSVLYRQSERYRDAIDEYYAFANEFPDSKYMQKADKMLKSSEKGLREAEALLPMNKDDLEYYRNYGNKAERKLFKIDDTTGETFND